MKSFIKLTKKQAVASDKSSRKSLFPGLRKKRCKASDGLRHLCRIEELEKREMLAVDPISLGVVYVEDGAINESTGDKFYVAWVGGESVDGQTTLTQLQINLDKDGTEKTAGEAYFDTVRQPDAKFAASDFKLVTELTSEDIIIKGVYVEDGGQLLVIDIENFHVGDTFVFTIDVDEFPAEDGTVSDQSSLVEGAEFGGSPGILTG